MAHLDTNSAETQSTMLIRLDGVVVQIEKFIILAGVKWALIHMMNAHARVHTHIRNVIHLQ